MRFGTVPVRDAEGAISAHSVRRDGVAIRKGAAISAADVLALAAAGIREIVAARLHPGDVGEDEAAGRLAEAVAGGGVRAERPWTGRSNLFATSAGVLRLDRDAIDRINAADEAVTVATLPDLKPVVDGEMVATVKIIPYAVPGAVLREALSAAADASVVAVAPYRVRRVGMVSTVLPGLKDSTIAKTEEAFRDRLRPTGAELIAAATCGHDASALAAALSAQVENGCELVAVFGASAIADRHDVIPSAIEGAGGRVDHFGMPVDPGNLLLVGRVGNVPVLGAPGCARSPKENGFDWVLHRLLADIPVTRRDIARLGVGGLLMEIVSRPQPRGGGEPAEDA